MPAFCNDMVLIRETEERDIGAVLVLYEKAKASLRERGIPQWQDGYPNEESLRRDMADHVSYVMEEEGEVIGTACIQLKDDPNYSYVEGGQWLNEEPYAVIHRITVSYEKKGRGYAGRFFAFAEQLAREDGRRNVRADTHQKNASMKKALETFGFRACGTVYMADGAPRIAYHKVIE